MSMLRPAEVRRSFKAISVPRTPSRRRGPAWVGLSTNSWPKGTRLDYEFLERCKEPVCRVLHPTAWYRHKQREYRISIMPWSRGGYLDIRMYGFGRPLKTGILLHQDVLEALLPDLIWAAKRLAEMDEREPEQKAKVVAIPA